MLIISYKASADFKEFLKGHSIYFIQTIANPNLDKRIADHPDLSLFVLDDKKIVVADEVYDYYKEKLPAYKLIRGGSVKDKYPYDALYNVVKFKNYYIHNDHIEDSIKNYFAEKGISFLKINQGYSRCSSIVLKNMILTDDFGIYKSLRDKVDIRLLARDAIRLDGFDQGFIGGTCGLYGDRLIFTGDISKHKDFAKIKASCQEENINILYPTCDLVDLGSLICL